MIEQNIAPKIIIPSPFIKSPHGKVPKAMPILPNKFGMKFIIEEAVPTFSLALFSKVSIPKGLAKAPIAVKGKNDNKNANAFKCPGNKTKSPLTIETAKHNCISLAGGKVFFSRKYIIGPKIEIDALAAKK